MCEILQHTCTSFDVVDNCVEKNFIPKFDRSLPIVQNGLVLKNARNLTFNATLNNAV